MSPEVGGSRRTAIRAKVDLPQPDSPTRPRVSPAAKLRLTSFTASTRAERGSNNPRRAAKARVTCRNSINMLK